MKNDERYDVLSFIEMPRKERVESSQRYFDFAINRRPLSLMLVELNARDPSPGIFGWQSSKVELAYALQLLRRAPSELRSGRVPLYVCGQCGDLGCSCVAVAVSEYEECVVWSAIGYDNNHSPAPEGEIEGAFPDLRAFYFLRTQYEEALDRFSAGRRMKPRT